MHEDHDHHGHDHGHQHHGHSHARPADVMPPSRFAEAERMTEPPRDLKPGNDS